MTVIDPYKLPAAAVEAAAEAFDTHGGRLTRLDHRMATATRQITPALVAFLDALLADDEAMRSLVERYQGVMIGFNDPRVRRMRAALTAAVQEKR